MTASYWTAWQFADSAFPAGGFAHSAGLEAAWKHGKIRNTSDLRAFAETALLQQAYLAVPLAHAVHQRPECFQNIDRFNDALLVSNAAVRASKAQGRAMLNATAQIYRSEPITRAEQACREDQTPGHQAPVFGLVTHTLGLPATEAMGLMAFQQLRMILSAAVRLGIVGPVQGQQFQHDLAPLATRLTRDGMSRDPAAAAQPAPLIELMQANQDRIYSRLFQS